MVQKWQTLRSETLLKDRWVDLRADYCVTATGSEIGPYYVLSYPDWVHVVALTEAGCVVLVRQYRHASGKVLLELPGGAVDPADADIEQAASRELEEETGFTASHWQLIVSLYPNPATHTNRVHMFLALNAECNRPQSLDPGEDGLKVELLSVPVLLEGLSSGLLGHAAHASGLLLGLAAAGRLNFSYT
jgi:8-oxo-dGTP pyrophosphatase MutT (NUDIX family)